MPVALITGGTAGLGRALTDSLADRGWTVVVDGRRSEPLRRAVRRPGVVGVVGDIADPRHQDALVEEVERQARLDLLVHNASTLGPLPMRPLAALTPEELLTAFTVNAGAPHALTRRLLPHLRSSGGVLVSLSSDAVVEHYETWGAYGATKAALDHLSLTWAAEEGLPAYVVDPGDMRTAMHQDAFAGEDISDRPDPGSVVPHLLGLLEARPPSGRYRARDLAVATEIDEATETAAGVR